VRFAPFFTTTRIHKLPAATLDVVTVQDAAVALLGRVEQGRPVRLLGVRVSLERPSLGGTGEAPPSSFGEVTVTGTVEDGVEHGCVILRTGTTLYQLIGSDPAVVAGAQVTVRGRPDPDLLTICQQGTPLHVIEMTPGG
jgi:hypothetical protein